MQARLFAPVAALAALLALSCGKVAGPSEPVENTGMCVTDFSCAFGEECDGAACAPIAPTLRPHIQTASFLLRDPIDANEASWRASHFDVLIAVGDLDVARAANPNAKLYNYLVTRFNRFDLPGTPKTAMAWAANHGYNGEDFYLHYKEDTVVPTWEGKVIVPGYAAGVVPGWVPGSPKPGATAQTRDQSRVPGYYSGGEPWWMANLANPGYRKFLDAYLAGSLDGTWWYNQKWATGPADGTMIDVSIWYPAYHEGVLEHSVEYYGIPVNDGHPYTYAVESSFPALAADMLEEFGSTKDIMPNYSHVLFLNYDNRCAQNIQKTTPWIYGEVWVTYTGLSGPTQGTGRCMSEDYDYDQGVRQIIYQTRAGGRRVLGAQDLAGGLSGTDRGKMLTLALYYLVHNSHTYYMYESTNQHSQAEDISTWNYNPAVDFDIGQPDQIPNGTTDFEGKANTKEHFLFKSGADPIDNTLTYHVWARRFTNALVLVKLMPVGSNTGSLSATTVDLGGSYMLLNVDGTVGAPVTQTTIRNNEALILIPAN